MHRYPVLALLSYLCVACDSCPPRPFDQGFKISEEELLQAKLLLGEAATERELCEEICQNTFDNITEITQCRLETWEPPYYAGEFAFCSGYIQGECP